MAGAKLPDPTGVFKASLDGGTRRAIDLRDGEMMDEAAFGNGGFGIRASKLR